MRGGRRWRGLSLAVAAGALVLALGGSAQAQGDVSAQLDVALKQLDELRYDEARSTLLEIVQSGQATAPELSKAYFNIGVVEAALDHGIEATDAFYLALMIEPTIVLPAGSSPKIREYLNDARTRVMQVGVLDARVSLRKGTVGVVIENDPLRLVKQAKVRFTKGEGETSEAELDPKGKTRIDVGSDVTEIEVSLLDERGNQLKSLKAEPGTSEEKEPLPVGDPTRPSWIGNWGVWAGLAAFLGAGGTYFMVKSGKAQSSLDDYRSQPEVSDEVVQDLQDDKDRYGLLGLATLGAAGAAAVTAGAIILFSGDDSEQEQAVVVPTLSPTRVGAELNLRF